MLLTIAAEDILCEVIARRLVSDYLPDAYIKEPSLGLTGIDDLRGRIPSCNAIAQHIGPVLILTDSDRPDPCPPAFRRYQFILIPPSTLIAWPVMFLASSEARNAASLPMSSGVCSRFMGIV